MRLLVTTDGSETALKGVRHALALVAGRGDAEIHLLNVQPPLTGTASTFLPGDAVKSYHAEEGEAALKPARALLEAARVKFEAHVAVGDPAEAICAYARARNCDQIVISARGLGALGNLLLGSVSTRVIELATVPVTIVK